MSFGCSACPIDSEQIYRCCQSVYGCPLSLVEMILRGLFIFANESLKHYLLCKATTVSTLTVFLRPIFWILADEAIKFVKNTLDYCNLRQVLILSLN